MRKTPEALFIRCIISRNHLKQNSAIQNPDFKPLRGGISVAGHDKRGGVSGGYTGDKQVDLQYKNRVCNSLHTLLLIVFN